MRRSLTEIHTRIRVCVDAMEDIPDPAAFVKRAKAIEEAARVLLDNVAAYEAWNRPVHAVNVLNAALAMPGGANASQ